jgi:hypothetical protein
MHGFERFYRLFEWGQPSTRNWDRRNGPVIEYDQREPFVVSGEVAYVDKVHVKALVHPEEACARVALEHAFQARV